MPVFVKGGNARTPFGKNVYLRSTRGTKFIAYTVASGSVPAVTIDTFANQKVLQPGTVMAKITSTADAGKIGPFSAGATDGRQTLANIVGINDTFLPWQLIERDVEVGILITGVCVQAWCFEGDAGNLNIALTNTTADAMRSTKTMDILFY
jgi:hypothetical protein